MFARNQKSMHKGFTLIELTIGISVLSVALLVMTGALFPQAARSTDPWHQIRATELASSMMDEILARKFDENSFVTGELRCGEDDGNVTAPACALSADLAANVCGTTEEANRADYDDVDDFNCLQLQGPQITNISGVSLGDAYAGYSVDVSVRYATGSSSIKIVTVDVTPPRGSTISFSAFKVNY